MNSENRNVATPLATPRPADATVGLHRAWQARQAPPRLISFTWSGLGSASVKR
jgi:hypothetical protein